MKQYFCHKCGTLVATIKDGSVRRDIVMTCGKCHKAATEPMPDFFAKIFGGKK